MNNCKYQIRDNVTSRLLLEDHSKEALVRFLKERNPSSYTIFRLTHLTNEIRQIVGARRWLRETSS